MPPCQYACSGRGANRGARVETVEDYPVLGHLIEVRGLHERVTGKPAISVPMVIRHDEDYVGSRLGLKEKGKKEKKGQDAK